MISCTIDECKTFCDRGTEQANSGRYEQALACYDRALALSPDNHTLWILRGGVLTYLNCYKEALDSFERALKIQPNDRDALLFQGLALHHLGYYKRAYACYDQVLGIERKPIWQKLISLFQG